MAFLRYVAQDGLAESSKGAAMIESLSSDFPSFNAMVSVVEMVCVLQSCYQSSKSEIVSILGTNLRADRLDPYLLRCENE
ncbi:hypothetical protein PS838_01446 [Pseudomonas fluorescens]|nr:hypothetical protein PS838_01446 [Pseudomonas fluorescens]